MGKNQDKIIKDLDEPQNFLEARFCNIQDIIGEHMVKSDENLVTMTGIVTDGCIRGVMSTVCERYDMQLSSMDSALEVVRETGDANARRLDELEEMLEDVQNSEFSDTDDHANQDPYDSEDDQRKRCRLNRGLSPGEG